MNENKIRCHLLIENKWHEILVDEVKYFSKSYCQRGIKNWFSSEGLDEYKTTYKSEHSRTCWATQNY